MAVAQDEYMWNDVLMDSKGSKDIILAYVKGLGDKGMNAQRSGGHVGQMSLDGQRQSMCPVAAYRALCLRLTYYKMFP